MCAKDSFCCTTAWDDLCVAGVTKEKCGTCSGGSDAGTTDNVGSDTKPDATAVDVTVTTADK
ncbi:MAG: hypothetical protein FJ100_11160 [Deltaproteobacteria bacterium]|nr:hypothetical protein [Deltaproteobacteria bacterium]